MSSCAQRQELPSLSWSQRQARGHKFLTGTELPLHAASGRQQDDNVPAGTGKPRYLCSFLGPSSSVLLVPQCGTGTSVAPPAAGRTAPCSSDSGERGRNSLSYSRAAAQLPRIGPIQ